MTVTRTDKYCDCIGINGERERCSDCRHLKFFHRHGHCDWEYLEPDRLDNFLYVFALSFSIASIFFQLWTLIVRPSLGELFIDLGLTTILILVMIYNINMRRSVYGRYW